MTDSKPTTKESAVILAGDVGGTKIALASYRVSAASGSRLPRFEELHAGRLASEGHDGLAGAVGGFLTDHGIAAGEVGCACFGVAGPVLHNVAEPPNLGWRVDGNALARELGLGRVVLINDLVATGEGIPALRGDQLETLQEGKVDEDGNAAIIAAGTGLGMALMPWVDGRHVTVPTEGGHQGFAPRGPREIALMKHMAERYGRVSVERVASGMGLFAIYQYLRDVGYAPEDPEVRRRMESDDPGRIISEAAMEEGDPLADGALDLFVSAYGAAAGDLALVGYATGGLYVGGGIAPKILPRLQHGPFLASFRDKGRFRELVERIPVKVLLDSRTALLGAALVAARNAGF